MSKRVAIQLVVTVLGVAVLAGVGNAAVDVATAYPEEHRTELTLHYQRGEFGAPDLFIIEVRSANEDCLKRKVSVWADDNDGGVERNPNAQRDTKYATGKSFPAKGPGGYVAVIPVTDDIAHQLDQDSAFLQYYAYTKPKGDCKRDKSKRIRIGNP